MVHGTFLPRIRSLPTDIASSAGQDAIDLARLAGLVPDPWQEVVIHDALSERADGKWSAFEVGLITPRQNGKNSIIEIRELAGLFLFEEELILHSAHEFNTASEGFMRIKFLIGQSPDLTYKVNKITNSHGSEGIELKPSETIIMEAGAKFVKYGKAPRLKFVARTGGSGRGFTGDTIILDEAYRLPRRVISALMPTMSARPNPQIWYTSSAVDQEEHEHGEILTRVRHRGINKKTPRLYYAEYSADEVEYDKLTREAERKGDDWQTVAGRIEFWQQSNPGLGYRVSEDVIRAELDAMPEKTFKVERLAIGDWPPLDEDADSGPIKKSLWRSLRDDNYQHDQSVVFAVDVSVDRKHASIVVYSEDETDGGIGHIEVIERREGTKWVVPWLLKRREKWKPLAIGVDGKSPTHSLIFEMEKNGITRPADEKKPKHGDLIVMNLQDMAAAVGQFLDAATEEQIRHFGNGFLDSAVFGAELRKVGDLHVWGRREAGTDVSPLTAATIARWVYQTHKEALSKKHEMMYAWV